MIFLELFLTFFKIGAFTFGGGYAMLPMIEAEVTEKGWITVEELINFIAVSESTPGPFAINISTYIGAEKANIGGAFSATLGIVLPSFIIILIIAKFFSSFSENTYVKGCMRGLKPAVIGLIASAVLSVGASVFFPSGFSFSYLKDSSLTVSFIISAIMLVLELKKLNPIWVIILSAIMGICAGYLGLLN